MAENTEIHGKNTENETIYTEIKVHRLEALTSWVGRNKASSWELQHNNGRTFIRQDLLIPKQWNPKNLAQLQSNS